MQLKLFLVKVLMKNIVEPTPGKNINNSYSFINLVKESKLVCIKNVSM